MNLRGRDAEDAAAAYLQRQGLELLSRNYHCRYGEIDLIARDGSTLVFVEVRMRSSSRFGGAGESITFAKREKLMRAARHYLIGKPSVACRFDALLVDQEKNSQQKIEWLRGAVGE